MLLTRETGKKRNLLLYQEFSVSDKNKQQNVKLIIFNSLKDAYLTNNKRIFMQWRNNDTLRMPSFAFIFHFKFLI